MPRRWEAVFHQRISLASRTRLVVNLYDRSDIRSCALAVPPTARPLMSGSPPASAIDVLHKAAGPRTRIDRIPQPRELQGNEDQIRGV
jgi:hypothetical protein